MWFWGSSKDNEAGARWVRDIMWDHIGCRNEGVWVLFFNSEMTYLICLNRMIAEASSAETL